MIFIGVSNLQRAMKIYSIWRCTLQITRYFVCVCHTMVLLFLLETAIHNGIRKYSNLLHFINVQFRKKNQFFFLEQKKPNDIIRVYLYQQQHTTTGMTVKCLFIYFFLYIFFNEREFINQCCMVQGHNYFSCKVL